MIKMLCFMISLAWATSAAAQSVRSAAPLRTDTPATARQTHPCDVTVLANPQVTTPVKYGVCHSGKDLNGNPTTITKFTVKFDGVTVFDGPLTPVGAPNAAGASYYETPPIAVAQGNHTATSTATSAAGTSPSAPPFDFAVVADVPSPPTNPRVKK